CPCQQPPARMSGGTRTTRRTSPAMAIRIRVYPQPGSIGARRNRQRRVQQQRLQRQQVMIQRQQELLRRQQMQVQLAGIHGMQGGYGAGLGYGAGFGYATGIGAPYAMGSYGQLGVSQFGVS